MFGLYGKHTVESCPLSNRESRKQVIDGKAVFENSAMLKEKYNINKIIGQYHSALEHTFLWVVDADSPHLLQQASIDSGLAKFNSVKIVPLSRYSDVVAKCEKIQGQDTNATAD